MHTAEHILNQTMVRMFGCPRSKNAHIERKKSKCDYELQEEPTAEMMEEVERRINEVIDRHLPVGIPRGAGRAQRHDQQNGNQSFENHVVNGLIVMNLNCVSFVFRIFFLLFS